MALPLLRPDPFTTAETFAFRAPVETPLLTADRNGNLVPIIGYEVKPHAVMELIAHETPTVRLLYQDRLFPGERGYRRFVCPFLKEQITAIPLETALQNAPNAYSGLTDITSIAVDGEGIRAKFVDGAMPLGVTPGEMARAYFKRIKAAGLAGHKVDGMDSARIGYRREARRFLPPSLGGEVSAPFYFRPGPHGGRWRGRFAYIDLSAAYWMLMHVLTLDPVFRPEERYLAHGIIPFYDVDDITPHKPMRVGMFGCMSSEKIARYRHGKGGEFHLGRGAVWLAPDLVGAVMYWMHAIAAEIIDTFGAIMVLTDAYIVPEEVAQDVLDFLATRWHMPAKLEGHGDSGIYAWGCYQVGSHKSRHAPASWTKKLSGVNAVPDPEPVDNILPDVRGISGWLQERREQFLALDLPRHGLHEADGHDFATASMDQLLAESRVCEQCGHQIPAFAPSNARFCSNRCRQAQAREQKRQSMGSRNCQREKCPNKLPEKARANTRFCSSSCKEKARRTQAKGKTLF